jgi:hypothetical protein
MSSGAGDTPGFYEGRDAVRSQHNDKRDDDCQSTRAHGSRVARYLPCTDRRKCKENKAQNLMPKRMDGLHRGGKNVLYELACLAGQMLAGHDLILPKVKLVPARVRLYNQGNITASKLSPWPGTDGPVVASEEKGNRAGIAH